MKLVKGSGKCHKYFEDFVSCDEDTLIFIPRRDTPRPNAIFKDYPDTAQNIYKQIFNKEYSTNYVWGGGKWISVSKHRIRKTPKQVYQNMLDFVLGDYDGKEPSQHIYRTRGIFIERFILQCFM